MSTPIETQIPTEAEVTREAIRTPRAAAVAGIVFGVLLIVALVLVRMSVPGTPHDAGVWLTDSGHRHSIELALTLVPFAGIAFLWFIGVVRDRIGDAEDRFFATVFLGSGLLFVAMLFVAAATAAGLIAAADQTSGSQTIQVWKFGHQITYSVLTIYGMRMAAVFTISMSTLLLRTGAAPRWLGLSGYAMAAVLLLTVGFFPWIELLFPAWILVLSLYFLIETRQTQWSTVRPQSPL